MTMLEEPDPFEQWCIEHNVSEHDISAAFADYVYETSEWDGQQFSLSEDERHWIRKANEIVEWVRLIGMATTTEAHNAALYAAVRCVAEIRPMPGSLAVE